MPFADLHCDTIARLLACQRQGIPQTLRDGDLLHVNLEKLRASGYVLQTFALFVNLRGQRFSGGGGDDLYRRSMGQSAADPTQEVFALADCFHREMAENGDWVAPVCTAGDLEDARQAGKLAAVLAVEEGGVCRGDLATLGELFRRGVRLLTLTWNYENELGSPNGSSGGLTDTGLAFVAEMEELGMLADVSHLGDQGVRDLLQAAKRPFLATHSCARALQPHRRNLPDDLLRAMGEKGCLIGVNFYAPFLGESPVSRVEDIARHARHIARRAGIHAVALGSDFDGIDCPLEFGDAGGMAQVAEGLKKFGGFTEGEVEKICWQNAWEFFRALLPKRS
jgi:membrane dipeptidase